MARHLTSRRAAPLFRGRSRAGPMLREPIPVRTPVRALSVELACELAAARRAEATAAEIAKRKRRRPPKPLPRKPPPSEAPTSKPRRRTSIRSARARLPTRSMTRLPCDGRELYRQAATGRLHERISGLARRRPSALGARGARPDQKNRAISASAACKIASPRDRRKAGRSEESGSMGRDSRSVLFRMCGRCATPSFRR